MSRRVVLKELGVFDLGVRAVKVFTDTTSYGGKFWFVHDSGSSRIEIGIAAPRFEEVMGVALHEATEMAFGEMRLCYSPRPEIGDENGSFFFAMDHTAFSEAMSRSALLITGIYEPLKRVHAKHHAKSNRRR